MSSVTARPDVKATVEQVMSGELFTGLLLDDTNQRASALEALLGKVVDDDTRVIWVGNPLRSPLTIERFLIQIVGPEVDLREERGPAELARIFAKSVGHESRLLIVVQQPETINAETRELLVGMAGYLAGEAVHVQFLFAGSSAFAVPRLPKADLTTFASRSQTAEQGVVEDLPPRTRRRDVFPLVLLLLLLLLGVVFSMAPTSEEGMPVNAPPVAPPVRVSPILPPTPTPPPQLQPEVQSAEPSPLRRDFDAFLDQRTPALPPMTEAEKSFLFDQFLTHHRRE